MNLAPEARCPGSGMRMVSQTYVIRKIEDADRATYARRVTNAEADGDAESARFWTDSLAEWGRDQGQERERLVCPICLSSWLTPTSRGTSRPHRRHDVDRPSWDTVRRLRKEMQVLQGELDRALDALEE
jgi:hypothetical protein